MENLILNKDCIMEMKKMKNQSVDFTLTDIPYNAVNRHSNGLRNLDKKYADIITFSLEDFLPEVYRITKNSICIFCGKEQFSYIYKFFVEQNGTVRTIVWEKTNPSPMNGQYVYESGVELAVWFKKQKTKTFNAYCKNTVFKYPISKNKFHPTQKNINLFEELILDNTNVGDIVFDPCIGSGTTAIAAQRLNRKYLGFELNPEQYKICIERIKNGI